MLGQHASCSTAQQPVELSENISQNLFFPLPPQTVANYIIQNFIMEFVPNVPLLICELKIASAINLSRSPVEVVSDVVDAALQLRDALHDGLEFSPAQPSSAIA